MDNSKVKVNQTIGKKDDTKFPKNSIQEEPKTDKSSENKDNNKDNNQKKEEEISSTETEEYFSKFRNPLKPIIITFIWFILSRYPFHKYIFVLNII